MSLWGVIGGVVLGAAGVVTGQPELVAAGAGLVGSSIKSDSVDKAAKTQQTATNQAVGGLSPYTNLGGSAATTLQGLMGLPQSPTALNALPRTAQAPQTVNGAPTVPMRGPDGTVRLIPQNHVAYWQSRGATPVQ